MQVVATLATAAKAPSPPGDKAVNIMLGTVAGAGQVRKDVASLGAVDCMSRPALQSKQQLIGSVCTALVLPESTAVPPTAGGLHL